MARAKEHGNGKLEDALQALIQAQAILVQTQAESQAAYFTQKTETDKRQNETEKEMAQLKKEMAQLNRAADERFARIEAILLEHNRILSRLADTVGEKIGFKVPKSQPSEG